MLWLAARIRGSTRQVISHSAWHRLGKCALSILVKHYQLLSHVFSMFISACEPMVVTSSHNFDHLVSRHRKVQCPLNLSLSLYIYIIYAMLCVYVCVDPA